MYCTTCHNQTRKSGGLALDSLNTGNVGENTAAWEKMLQRLRARRDPPIGMARPEEALYETAISTAERALDHAYPMNPRTSTAPIGFRAPNWPCAWRNSSGTELPMLILQDAAKKGPWERRPDSNNRCAGCCKIPKRTPS